MKTRRLIYLLLLAFPFTAIAQANWENYELFNTRSGLPNNIVLSIAQDNNNLLWLGTRNGLCIYDGYEFEVKKDLFGAEDGEWGNTFCFLFKDRQGNIWVGTQNGHIAIYDARNDSVITFSAKQLIHRECIIAGYQDVAGRVWFGSNTGALYMADTKSRKLLRITAMAAHEGEGYVKSISEDLSGNIWINGTYKYEMPATAAPHRPKRAPIMAIKPVHRALEIHRGDGASTLLSENEVLSNLHYVAHVTPSGRLLIATSQLIKEYDADGRLLNRIALDNFSNYANEDNANFIFEDAGGILWLGTNFGLLKIDREKYKFAKFAANTANGRLNSNYVRSVCVDNDNAIWVGYRAGHVNKLVFDSIENKFSTISCLYKNPAEALVAINVIRQLRSGKLLFGGANGLFISPKNDPQLSSFSIINDKNIPPPYEVWALLEDRKGKIWVGTRAFGLYVFDPLSRKCRYYPNAHSSGSEGGLSSIWQIYEDYKGDIWLATENGLDSVIMAEDGYPEGFYNLHEHYTGKAGRQVWSIAEDSKHRLWVGTTVHGISMVDKANRTFVTYDHSNGLSSNVICGILADKNGYLWISSLSGISRFDVEQHTVLHFTENDGLAGIDFNFNACYRGPSGHLFFGSKSGLVSFHPDSIAKRKPAETPVLIRSFNIGNKRYRGDLIPGRPVVLNHDQNSFSFRFALPHFAAPASHSYKYMLKGFEDDWYVADARHPVASYTNVPPGNYTLLVKGSADGQHWSSTLQLPVTLSPAFWQRPLFRAFLVIAIILVAAGFIYAQFRRSIAKEREKGRLNQKFAELEFRALQAQMSPHFIFNSINAIQHFMLTSDELSANAYLSKFAKLMRLYLESSKNKYIALKEEIELLKLYVHLEKLRFDDKFDYSFTVDPYFEHTALEIPSMLLQPYVENAINHGLALRKTRGMLRISFEHTVHGISCVIDDDGVGRRYAEKNKNGQHPKSRGTDIINERLKAYRLVDDIEIKTLITDKTDAKGNAFGTRVEVLIPNAV